MDNETTLATLFDHRQVLTMTRGVDGEALKKLLMNAPVEDRLAVAGDREGMTPEGVAQFPDLLVKYGIDAGDCSPIVISKANTRARELVARVLAEVRRRDQPPQPDETKPSEHVKVEGTGQRVFGHSVLAIFRWMGANGWLYEEALRFCQVYDVHVSSNTIRTQLGAGRSSSTKRGVLIELSKEHLRELIQKVCRY